GHGASQVGTHPVEGDEPVLRQPGQIKLSFSDTGDASHRIVVHRPYVHRRTETFHLTGPEHGQSAYGCLHGKKARGRPHDIPEKTAPRGTVTRLFLSFAGLLSFIGHPSSPPRCKGASY